MTDPILARCCRGSKTGGFDGYKGNSSEFAIPSVQSGLTIIREGLRCVTAGADTCGEASAAGKTPQKRELSRHAVPCKHGSRRTPLDGIAL
jgi:hypothetical protein